MSRFITSPQGDSRVRSDRRLGRRKQLLKSRYLCGGSLLAVALAVAGPVLAQGASTVEEVAGHRILYPWDA